MSFDVFAVLLSLGHGVGEGKILVQPSISAKGIRTRRLHRLHFSSRPSAWSLAMSWPHSHLASRAGASCCEGSEAAIANLYVENDNEPCSQLYRLRKTAQPSG